ncbi:MAG: HD family phosphohydrolase [Bacteroidaceae bacterium]
MSRFNHRRKLAPKEIFFRTLAVLASIFVLASVMPGDTVSELTYKKGEPWDESPLIAMDSFPVFKPEEVLKRERDSLHRFYEPYFQQDPDVKDSMLVALKRDFGKLPKGSIPDYYLPHWQKKLADVYQRGVMSNEDYDRLQQERTAVICLFWKNEASARPFKQVFTGKTAYTHMTSEEDSVRFKHIRLEQFDLLKYIQPNLTYDEAKSMQQRQEVDNTLVPYMGQVQVGQKIVDRGQIVDEYTYCVLKSYERYQKEKEKSATERMALATGQLFYAMLMVLMLYGYFKQFRSDYLDSPRTVALVMSLYMVFPIITYGMMEHSLMSVYLVPYCILPIFIRIFMDSRTAFITHVIMLLTCAVALKHPFEFLVTESLSGLVAIYSLRQLNQRSDLLRAAITVTAVSLGAYLCMDIMNGNLESTDGLDKWTYIYLTIAGILSMVSYLLLIPVEKIFGFTSNVTLVELSNINNTVLRRLSEEAPGTFQHSMQVANLAAEVANNLMAKSQLVRTGALYHDIGKLENPVFFTENQSGITPHDNLSLIQSAQIIIRHVNDGMRLADKYKLPKAIKDFIVTHHGTSMAKYFYISYKNKYPDREPDPALFTYPGPNPDTLEQAILMMADAVEAASRSLPEYTEESVSVLVERIIDGQVKEGFFKMCPITFREIEIAKDVFKSKLKTIYHTRVQYPDEIKKQEGQEAGNTTQS